MEPTTMLRICLVLEWVFAVAALIASLALRHLLPEPLRAWYAAEYERDLSSMEMTILSFFIPLIISQLVATVGLFFLRRWAAWLYLCTGAIGILYVALTGPSVIHPTSSALETLATIMNGMVISLAFFTDALKKRSSEG
jgi:hypothetical protein